MGVLERAEREAKKHPATVILAEAEDPRVLKAASALEKHGIGLILLGDEKRIARVASKLRLKLKAQVISAATYPRAEQVAREMVLLRRHKGLVLDEARELLKRPAVFAAMLVALKQADGYVAGSLCGAADAIRPGLQLLRPATPWGYTLVTQRGRTLVFADTGVNVAPDAERLAAIAEGAAAAAERLGMKPAAAFIGFSNRGSTRHERAETVRAAVRLAHGKLNIPLDGELTLDAAIDPAAAKAAVKGSPVAGKANVLVFPDLHSASVAVAAARSLGGAATVGPIVLGAQPLGVVRRDASVAEIVAAATLVALHSR